MQLVLLFNWNVTKQVNTLFNHCFILCFYKSKKWDKDQESIQSRTTLDPGYHMGKYKKKTQFITTNESQEVSPFPAGDHKAAMNRRENMTNTRQK